MRQSTLRFELVGSAVAAGVLGATICFDAVPGLNWGLWTALVATELAIFARPRLGTNRAAFDVTIAFAVVLGFGSAVTVNLFSLTLTFVTVATLLGVAARLAAGLPAPLLGVRQLLEMPVAATFDAIREASARANATVRELLSDVSANVAVGLAIAIPVVAIFGLLLSGA